MHSSPAKAAAVAVRDEVAAAEAGSDRAADAVEAATVQEVTATAPKVPVIVQVEPKGAAAEAAAAVAVASTCLLTAVFAIDRGAIGEKTAQRRRANSYPGVSRAQVLATKRNPAHRTRRYWWWSCRYPKKTSPWKLRRSR